MPSSQGSYLPPRCRRAAAKDSLAVLQSTANKGLGFRLGLRRQEYQLLVFGLHWVHSAEASIAFKIARLSLARVGKTSAEANMIHAMR